MMKKLLLFFMMLAMAVPLWASEHTVTINRNEGLYQTGTGVYYCVKDGIMMTFTSGLDNENYLVEHQQVYFEVNSYNYIIKRIVFHCVDSTTTANLMDCFYWGPTTLSIVQNFYNQSEPGTLTVTDPYTAVWRGSSNHMQFTTMAKPVRFGSVEIVYDKLDGDIFDLVTDISQIVQGKTYILVTQNYDKVMKIKKTDDATFPATDIVGWMGPDGNEKSRVKVDGNAQLFRMEEVVDTTIDGYSRKSAWLNTLNGYIRPSSTSGSTDLILSTGVTDWNRSYSYIGTAYNFLARFKSKGSGHYIRYDSSNNGKFRMNNSTSDENTRVWLYKLADAYNVSTLCDPASGGTITLGDGVVEGTSQGSETVHFTVDPADGYSLTSVEVKMDNISFTRPVTDNGDGSYSFVMPAWDVTVTAHFEIAGAYQIFTENTPAGGGVVNVGGQVTTVDGNNYANGGNSVTVTPSPNWGWEATGVTVTDANNNEVTVTDNGNGSYSFTMPEADATVHAGYKRVVGDIFDLVTSGTQIVEGSTYIIVSQNYDKVMRYWTPGQTTFTSADIVDWPLGSDNKTKVRIDDNAVFFRMDSLNADTTSTGGLNLTRAAYLNTLNGYMRTQNYNVFLSSPLAQVNRGSMMVSGNAYNYLLRFLYDNTSGPNTNYVVRYNNADGNFNVLNWTNQTDNANVLTRVWLYKLAQAYSISTVCTPPEGGSITITGGMDESNMAQGGETVTLDVGTNWGWSISEVVVTNNTTGETITVNTVATSDAGNSYTFVMPDADVTITANFYESVTSLYLLGTAMGRTSWVPAGPRFNYDVNNEQYYLDVYFKGGNSNNDVDQAFGYFSLAKDIDHSITWQTARPDQGSWNAIQNVRLAAEYNYYAVQDGSTDVVLYGDRNDNSFKIPAGVYRIIVNKDMNRMSIVETHLSLNFDPVSGSQVNTGQVVTISSDLEATVHGIAQQYSINEDAQAFKNSTDNWVNQENGNTVVLNQLPPATVTVKAEANIGYIVVPGTAVYNMVPKVYTIQAIWSPENAGSVTVAPSANEGQTVTVTVAANSGYSLTSMTVTNSDTGESISYTDNGNGNYSFTMPADNVIIVANFSRTVYNITTVCDPEGAGEFHDILASATAGTTVNFTVSATKGYELDNVTLTVGDQVTTLTPDENGYYSFTMPEGNVTVTAHFLTPLQLIEHPDGPEGGSPVTVADELIGTWAAKHLLWAKDQAPQVSNDYVTIPDLQDYARQNFSVQPGKKFQSKEWDQSNWVILDFSTIPGWDKDNDYAEVSKYVDHKIDAGTITGQYECIVGETNAGDEYKVQHVIHLSAWPTCLNPTDPTSLGYPGYVGDPREEMTEYDYMYNHYLPANFMGDYIGGVFGHVPEGGVEAPNDSNVHLFFMNPKDREVAQLWGVWLGEMEFHNEYNPENRVITGDVFTVYKYNPENPGVNSYGLKGAIWVPQDEGWLYNRIAADNVDGSFGKPTGNNNELKTGAAYLFHAAITMQAFPYNGPISAPRRESENPQDSAVPDDEYWPWSHYMVYPLDLQSHNNNFTAVTEVRTRESIQIESIRYYNVMGQESQTPFDGINIEVIRYKDGSKISRKILR